MRPSVLALPLLPLSHLSQLGRAPSSAHNGILKLFLLFSPNYHEEPEARPSWEVHPTQSQLWEQQWGRSDAEGHEREPSRHQNKFLNNSTDQRVAAGMPAGLQIPFPNAEIPAGIPIPALTWAGTRNVATPICPFSLPASHSHTHDPLLPFCQLYLSLVSLFSSHSHSTQPCPELCASIQDREWLSDQKSFCGNKILGVTLCFCRMSMFDWL